MSVLLTSLRVCVSSSNATVKIAPGGVLYSTARQSQRMYEQTQERSLRKSDFADESFHGHNDMEQTSASEEKRRLVQQIIA